VNDGRDPLMPRLVITAAHCRRAFPNRGLKPTHWQPDGRKKNVSANPTEIACRIARSEWEQKEGQLCLLTRVPVLLALNCAFR
jgi:hypothetical protein